MTKLQENNSGTEFHDVSGLLFNNRNAATRQSTVRQFNPESAEEGSLSAFMLRYGRLRNEVLKRMKEIDTDRFWIEWMEDMMPMSPSASKMYALLSRSHLVSHADILIQMQIESVVVDYFKICTSIDIRSFVNLQNSPGPN